MSPVADSNLASYMAEAVNSVDKQSLLRTFFGCLCNGLQYLHQSKIRHRDVKPTNILVKGATVLWADFGISLDWADMSRSTTTTGSGRSLQYCAPEAAHFEPRNSSSDIWSLGSVFLEMITILKGQTIAQMRQTFKAYSGNHCFYSNIKPVNLWIEKLRTLGSDQDNQPLTWIKLMLNVNLRYRPTAQILFTMITNQHADSDTSFNPATFCGSCCVEDDESSFYSESDGEHWIEGPEEQRTLHPYPLPFNAGPALAQLDQHSAELESNFRQNQDPGHGSNDDLSRNIVPSCENNNGVELSTSMDIARHVQIAIVPHRSNFTFPGYENNNKDYNDDDDDDDDGSGILSPRNSVDHLQSSHIDPHRNCVFPDCDNDQGTGFSDRDSLTKHIRSTHLSQKLNCTFPGCNNNRGKGFQKTERLIYHILLIHMPQDRDCTFPGCDKNGRNGFQFPYLLRRHFQSVHTSQRFTCTFPGCDNKKGNGFANAELLKDHVRNLHSGIKSDCTFPGCDNNKGKGFSSLGVMKRHVRLIHLEQKSDCTFPGCDNKKGKGYTDPDRLKRHVGRMHSGEESASNHTSHGDGNTGKDFSGDDSISGRGSMARSDNLGSEGIAQPAV
jgi:serine/threonine protein kinase